MVAQDSSPDRETYRRVLDAVDAPVMIVREDYSLAYVNASAKALGDGADPVADGATCHALTHQSSVPCSGLAHRCPVVLALQTGRAARVRHLHHDSQGRRHWVEVIATPLATAPGEPRAVVEFHRDLSETRRLEQALLDVCHGVSDATGEPFFQGLVINLAKALEADHAIVGRLMPGQPGRVQTLAASLDGVLVDGFDYELAGTPCDAVHAQGTCVYPDEVAAKFPEDTLLATMGVRSYAGTPLRTSAGTVVGILCVMARAPLHHASNAETVLEIFASRAAAELERLSADGRRAEVEAQLLQSQKMEAVGRLAAGMAHDFRNLLSPIRGFTELALGHLDASHPAAVDLHDVLVATEAATKLVGELLTFSRDQALMLRPQRLGEALSGLSAVIRQALREDSRLVERFEDRRRVLCDAYQLRQVLLNLVVNARDALAPGGTVVVAARDVPADDPLVTRHLAGVRRSCTLWTVSDDGCGMDAETRVRVFEPFFTTRGCDGGTGLGLAVAHGIVSQHGGASWVDSEPGVGTTFSILLPHAATGLRGAAAEQPPVANGACAGVVLVVEDNPTVRRLLGRVIRDAGCQAIEAHDGEDALRWLERPDRVVDLLVTDVVMPDMSGPEVAAYAWAQRPSLRVLFVSGYPMGELDDIALCPGRVEFLAKPLSPAAVRAKLHALLNVQEPAGEGGPGGGAG
jgi:signal transduction histidine kinase/CheY-like chemotaxis protein